jgi:GNAT superfamily N-acetyltransferase
MELINIKLSNINEINSLLNIVLDAREFISNYNSPQWKTNYPDYNLLLFSCNNKELYTIYKEDEIIGLFRLISYEKTYDYIDGSWLSSDASYYAIHSLALNSNSRNKGYTKQIFEFIEKNAINNHIKTLRIDTHELNKPMINSLMKNGFTYCGIIYLDSITDNTRLAFEKIVSL